MTTAAQRAVWRHNSFFGHCRMMEAQLKIMIKAETTSIETKSIATDIEQLVRQLSRSLKTRV